ncbi:MAG: hypothetical protein ONB11_09870 [candidate division KSB1 bacterium]|nr:hypothetical protein [candidate division KSB1 bacterium]
MGFRTFLLLVMVFGPVSHCLWAQWSEGQQLFYQIGFQQNLNAYQWLSSIQFQHPIWNQSSIAISQYLNSALIDFAPNDQKWKDDQRLNVDWSWRFSPQFTARLSVAGTKFSDRLSGLVSDINTNWATAGFLVRPLPALQLASDWGFKYDERLSRIDRGLTYNVQCQTEPFTINDYTQEISLLQREDRYAIRRNSDLDMSYRVRRQFQQDTYDSLAIYWSKKRRDNYDPLELTKIYFESLEDEKRGIQNDLFYGVRPGMQFRFRTVLDSRVTSISKFMQRIELAKRAKREFHSQNEIGFIFRRSRIMVDMSLLYETNDQKNEVPDSLRARRFSKYFYYISPDYQSNRLNLAANIRWSIGRTDTLQLSTAVSRYQYDTPETNMDDRDEFRFNLGIAEIHRFNPWLKLMLNGSINLYHLVYIFSERSANNNWMRILRLYPQIIYQPDRRFSLMQQLEVLANYTEYDFETASSSDYLKSYVFRRFSFTNDIRAQVTQKSSVLLNYKIELEENGKLDWDRWIEYLLTTRQSHWLKLSLQYQLHKHSFITPGLLLLSRRENYQRGLGLALGVKEGLGDIRSYGPTLKLNYQPSARLNLSIEAMRRVVLTAAIPRRYINHFDVNLTWYR